MSARVGGIMEDLALDSERVEAWLDDNSDFAHYYFVRKASR